MYATSIYMPHQIATVYFDGLRDLHRPESRGRLLSEIFPASAAIKPRSVGSADRYLNDLGFHEDQVRVFRSHLDRAVLNELGRRGPKGALCDFDDDHYLGLRLNRSCFSADRAAVAAIRQDFVASLNAAKPDNYKLFWTNVADFRCTPLPEAHLTA